MSRNECIHPSVFWREALEESGLTQAEVARRMRVSPKHLNMLLKGHGLARVDTVLNFAVALGAPQIARLLWRQQADFVFDRAEGKEVTWE